MSNQQTPDTLSKLFGELKESKAMRERWAKLEAFQLMLNQPPPDIAIEATPDGKAKTMVISHVENALDTFFLGQWSTKDFQWKTVGNELAGVITLEVTHPITGTVRCLIGAAAGAIMMDKAPDGLQGQEKNIWAQDIRNKKSLALKMNLPSLKSECLKNAAAQLGKAFGKDLNRKNKAGYAPKMGKETTRLPKKWLAGAKVAIESGNTTFDDVITGLENEGIAIPQDQLVELGNYKQLA